MNSNWTYHTTHYMHSHHADKRIGSLDFIRLLDKKKFLPDHVSFFPRDIVIIDGTDEDRIRLKYLLDPCFAENYKWFWDAVMPSHADEFRKVIRQQIKRSRFLRSQFINREMLESTRNWIMSVVLGSSV